MNYKNILMILIIIIVAEIGWLALRFPKLKSLKTQEGQEAQGGIVKEEKEVGGEPAFTEVTAGEEGARFWLEPNEGEFFGQFNVDIFVESPKPIDGLDVRLFYPQDKLSVIDQDNQKEGIQASVGKFDDYPINKVDEEQGLILLSGIVLGKTEELVPLNQPFLVGRVTFKIVAPGEANLSFDFQPGLTTDSNVAASQTAKDILKETLGAEYSLK